MTDQVKLIEERPPTRTFLHVHGESIYQWGSTSFMLKPSPELKESIRRYGIEQPISVASRGVDHGVKYSVRRGFRRLICAYELFEETGDEYYAKIPIVLVEADDVDQSILSVSDHALRKDNPLHEYEEIKRLVGQGLSEKQVAKRTGMDLATVRKRLRLSGLASELLDATYEGRVAITTAEAAAGLSPARQTDLIDVLHEKGKVTGADVKQVKQALQTQAIEETFEGLEPEEEKPERDKTPTTEEYLNTLARHLVETGFCVRTSIQEPAPDEVDVWLLDLHHDDPDMTWQIVI